MSATTVVLSRIAHVLIRKVDARGRGVWHAAILTRTDTPVWLCACGRTIHPSPGLETPSKADAERIITDPASQLCAGCDRVGEALS